MAGKVDTREPAWKKAIFTRAGWEAIALKNGDYQFYDATGKLVSIEHKTVEKMVEDMKSGVLTRQCRNLCENVDFPILMIEGHWAQSNGSLIGSSITWKQAWNQLMTIQDMGCRLQLATSSNHANERIFELEEYYGREAHPSALRQPSGNPYIISLSLINGIGVEKAKAIERLFPSLHHLCQAGIYDLIEVEGIGEAIAKRIHAFLRGQYG